jgi:predicted ATPase
LPAEFPPLRSLDALPNNLPLQFTSFVGREREVRDIRNVFADTRLLTLIGSGGCGKTRLALQAAADLVDEYPDGVWWVELAPVTDQDLVSGAAAIALRVKEVPGQPLVDTLVHHLRERQALLVLDNCEHLVGACASLVDTLVRACPDVSVLATSREPLGVEAETPWRVPSLTTRRAGPFGSIGRRNRWDRARRAGRPSSRENSKWRRFTHRPFTSTEGAWVSRSRSVAPTKNPR